MSGKQTASAVAGARGVFWGDAAMDGAALGAAATLHQAKRGHFQGVLTLNGG